MIGRSQRMNSFSPPKLVDQLRAGSEKQVERVAEHHLVAERLDVTRLQGLDRPAGGEWDERRRADVAVGQVQRARAGR